MSSKHEAEKDFLMQKYLLMVFLIFVGIMMSTCSRDEGVPYALLLVDSETKVGTVTRWDEVGSNHRLTYRFSDKEGTHYSKSGLVNHNIPFQTHPGSSIEITYFPFDPDISEATSLIPYLEPAFWIMAIGAALVVISGVYSFISIVQLVKHYKEDRYH